MAEYTVTIPLPDTKRGDKWPGVPTIGPILINGAQPTAELARIRMTFRKGKSTFTLDSDPAATPDAPIVISNATTWAANIPAVQSFLPEAGSWSWDMEFFSAGDSNPLTFYQGVIIVHPDVPRPS